MIDESLARLRAHGQNFQAAIVNCFREILATLNAIMFEVGFPKRRARSLAHLIANCGLVYSVNIERLG